MAHIAVLSEELINKIAAGEVVERPASVIKELAENSLDAKAGTVRVKLRGAGRSLISVVDDGSGMSPDDAQLALMRHATSKLRDLEGLSRIASKGFRGEALPAIASVSRLTLTTSEPGATVGARIHVEGGRALERAEAPPATGTSVDVEDLFFNVPARRKFLRRDQTELAHAREAVSRLALAHPEVGFFLEHDDTALLAAPATADPRERIAAAFGPEIHPHLVPVEDRRLGVSVTGHIATPDFTLPSARGLYTFVNHRYIRDRGLNHAVQRAFRDSLAPGRQPVAILFIELDPRSVDVNVHPQKLEVRFADSSGVYDAVFFAVRRALGESAIAASSPEAGGELDPGARYALAVEHFLTRAQEAPGAWLPIPAVGERAPVPLGFGEARPGLNEAPPPGYFASLKYLGTLGKRFWVCEGVGGSLVAIDPHAALERVRLCQFRNGLDEGGGSAERQRFLFPSTVTLPIEQARVLAASAPLLERLSLEIEPFGGGSIALRSVPLGLLEADPLSLLDALAAALVSPHSPLSAIDDAIQVMACHAAGSANRAMTQKEMDAVFSELERSDFQPACIHHGVVALEIPLLDLEARSR